MDSHKLLLDQMDVKSQVFITVNILIMYNSLDKLILIGQSQNSVVKFCKKINKL